MSAIRELLQQNWDYAMNTEDWSPPLAIALDGVDHKQALWKPEGAASNSIWELVNHLTYYKERWLHHLQGLPKWPEVTDNDTTFTVTATGEEAWQEAVAKLKAVHMSFQAEIAKLTDAQLDGADPDVTPQNFMSLILHDSYHTGQIMLLRKLQGSWQARRS